MTDFTFYVPPRRFRVGSSSALNRERIPESLVNRFVAALNAFFKRAEAYPDNDDLADRLIWMSLGLGTEVLGQNRARRYRELAESRMSSVDEFIELMEMSARVAQRTSTERWFSWVIFSGQVQEMLILDRMGFRLTDDALIVDAGTEIENAAVDDARAQLLTDPRFADAEAKFTSALQILARNDPHEFPAASHAAVSALEEVCREILSDHSILLDKALDKIKVSTGFDVNLVESIKKVFHYRGNKPGAAHGAGEASEPETRFVVHLVAAAVVAITSAADIPS